MCRCVCVHIFSKHFNSGTVLQFKNKGYTRVAGTSTAHRITFIRFLINAITTVRAVYSIISLNTFFPTMCTVMTFQAGTHTIYRVTLATILTQAFMFTLHTPGIVAYFIATKIMMSEYLVII